MAPAAAQHILEAAAVSSLVAQVSSVELWKRIETVLCVQSTIIYIFVVWSVLCLHFLKGVKKKSHFCNSWSLSRFFKALFCGKLRHFFYIFCLNLVEKLDRTKISCFLLHSCKKIIFCTEIRTQNVDLCSFFTHEKRPQNKFSRQIFS